MAWRCSNPLAAEGALKRTSTGEILGLSPGMVTLAERSGDLFQHNPVSPTWCAIDLVSPGQFRSGQVADGGSVWQENVNALKFYGKLITKGEYPLPKSGQPIILSLSN